jgi:hypothetical protein
MKTATRSIVFWLLLAGSLLGLHFNAEDKGNMWLVDY